MKWETVIGLEVHAELSTKSKIFCACTTSYGGEPNTHVCPVCAGMPGVLPKLNRSVVEYALRLGIALNCAITKRSKFDRKNYFYPDLPKAYQVSQLYAPICRDGHLEIEADGQKKKIGIREIHMEEDAGKLIHDPRGGGTFMDFNRCGVPLLEIVTHPDFRSAAEALAYLEKLRETLLYLDVCDCKMQEGSIRADINLSVRQAGGELGVRTETKNMNSFKAIGRAIEYEIERQIDILEDGGQVVQETRRWDDDSGTSSGMRSKENAQDYRYFPEPDLLPIDIDDAWLESVRANLPELAHQKRERYNRDFGIPESEARILTYHRNISALFETVARQSGQPVEAAHLITGEIMRLLNNANILPEDVSVGPSTEARQSRGSPLDAAKLSALIALVTGGKINRGAYKETVEAIFTCNVDPEAYIAEKGLLMINDDTAVIEAVKTVISENQDTVAEYRAGKEKVFAFLMGQVMKKLGGKGNPEIMKKTLTGMLGKEK
ncbi:MAG: Asp-tRNA(Asn)/Glu-tRNA(Gln) amidotransferase subunit GatB [Treponema sp.]|jgi:aspartyl-tRNA(Asn)/glutamyl-tRNA(Gln) amidotransferase subunit B|nr:Asp-tRNA(Asn)/Glu-tRNA(Gln) amidotransferase subunit GatB [Treponema sp.]